MCIGVPTFEGRLQKLAGHTRIAPLIDCVLVKGDTKPDPLLL
jgi:hypothetical protein